MTTTATTTTTTTTTNPSKTTNTAVTNESLVKEDCSMVSVVSIDDADETSNDHHVQHVIQQPSNHRKLYILSLVQMYQDIYHQHIIQFYKDMIWNMTKARRAMQSRSISRVVMISGTNASSTVTSLNVIHIPLHRTFHAQRRIYYTRTNNITNTTSTASNDCRTMMLHECDEHGRKMHVDVESSSSSPPPLTKEKGEEDEEDQTDQDCNDNHNDMNTELLIPDHPTGLRQRRGRPNIKLQQTTQPPLIDTSTTSIIHEDSKVIVYNDKEANKEKKGISLEENHMIQLLLLSSGIGTGGTPHLHHQQQQQQQHILQASHNKSLQLLQYIATIQTLLLQQIQNEMQ